MKSISMIQAGNNHNQVSQQRRGSTLLVVIALLAILALMAVVFYTFAAQEQTSAENFADAAINEADPGLQADVLFNWGLEQLIKGPDKYRKNSALWGGDYPPHSMIYNMLGDDEVPFNGRGLNVVLSTNGPDVDTNFDGVGEDSTASRNLVGVNLSPAARAGESNSNTAIGNLPDMDVDYTSPDINTMFLAYKGYVPGPAWPGNPNDVRLVIIPSFHRPQYMRTNTGGLITNPYGDTNVTTRVFRPHNDHTFIHRETGNDSTSSRFSTNVFDNSGYTNPGALGVWTGHSDAEYSLDVDNDGDTINEGVWLDLDFPPIEDPQNPGQYIIPMFSFTVYDTDGLINLNTAGNMRQPDGYNLNYAPTGTFGNNTTGSGSNQFIFLSRSHQGLSSPGEINPQWALTARIPGTVGTAFNQHRMFFGAEPNSWPELSNMEYFFLNYGRADFTVPSTIANGTKSDIRDLINGRWGEPNRLYAAQRDATGDNLIPGEFSRPGQSGVDDNADRFEGSNQSGSLQGSRSGAIAFNHPLAHNGAGRSWASGVNYRRTNLQAPSGGPAAWPYYVNYEIAGPPLANYPASVRWPSGLFNNPGSVASENHLLDDSDEIVVDMEKVQRPYDDPFGPEEMAHLQLSGTDIVRSGVTSRLASLMPMNFGTTGGSDYERRKRFTTMSWDRKQFSKPVDGNSIFPPRTLIENGLYRPELVALIGVNLPQDISIPGVSQDVINGIVRNPLQLKLNLNQLLVFENTGTGRTVSYRPLTPHPGEDRNDNGSLDAGEDLNGNTVLDSLPSTAINSSWNRNNLPAYPPTTLQQQEFWARYDRQRMARDIYTLLCTLDLDYSTSPATYRTGNFQLQMAQFAVNLVDALDPDDVMTRFEYDTDISDGWGLDDNPYTSTGETQRNVVWGVEEQLLTLSEFILVQSEDQMSDLTVTQFPDDKVDGTDKQRLFSAIELRNMSPYTVEFGLRGKWMVGLEVNGTMVSYAVPKRRTIDPGGLFTLLSSNAGDTFEGVSGDPYSEFRVDLDSNGDFTGTDERIIPAGNIASPDKIDMVTDMATTNNLVSVLNSGLTATASGPGSFLSQAETDLVSASNVKVKLFRKAHLGRDTYLATGGIPVPDDDNPWVLVDEMSVDKTSFDLDTDTAAAATPKLPALQSKERSQPLNKKLGESVNSSSGNIRNTIGQNNENGASPFTLWQPHFDRDFASVVELFSIPIVGPTQEITASDKVPNDITSELDSSDDPIITTQRLLTYALADSNGQQADNDVQVAGIKKFLSNAGTSTSAPNASFNYWYRLFEFIEVPTRIHRQLANPLKDVRVPGKINLNTIRHPSVLAALIDDIGDVEGVLSALNYDSDIINGRNHYRLSDRADSARDWWSQFLISRDGFDSTVSNLHLPGAPGSFPFRSFDFTGSPGLLQNSYRNPRENSLLRSLPLDRTVEPDNPRQLFEVATQPEHEAGDVDFHTRNRILSKLIGNTTTRSNTFTVFMSVAYFEASGAGLTAHDDVVQIGDRAHGKSVHVPDYRGFFVVDRTRVEEAYEPTTKKFDNWKRLVRYRHLIQSIQED
ncbi:hypothetical protein [Gimesia sp.]|uniref:hypothetical protein n=1 Tax=Gimesia sp. TaxID=2024833 RepID=UPI003A95B228